MSDLINTSHFENLCKNICSKCSKYIHHAQEVLCTYRQSLTCVMCLEHDMHLLQKRIDIINLTESKHDDVPPEIKHEKVMIVQPSKQREFIDAGYFLIIQKSYLDPMSHTYVHTNVIVLFLDKNTNEYNVLTGQSDEEDGKYDGKPDLWNTMKRERRNKGMRVDISEKRYPDFKTHNNIPFWCGLYKESSLKKLTVEYFLPHSVLYAQQRHNKYVAQTFSSHMKEVRISHLAVSAARYAQKAKYI